jgi:cystathionine beta-lyase/cystathionine gamma-synthase
VGADRAFGSVSVPIYATAIYRYEKFGKHRGFDYSRSENPTRQAVEKAITDLEGGERAVAFSSGMAAIQAVMTLFRSGKKTRAVFLETPTNPLMKIADIREVSRIARKRKILSIVDNTFMSPLLQRPIALGTDVVVHSATKFLGGHNDLIGGAVVTADPDLGEKMHFAQKAVGAVLSPFDSWLLLRGVKTLAVRVARAQENAEAAAAFLAAHPFVRKVFYPGLPGHHRRAMHFSQADGPGAIISFELARESAVPSFLNALKIVLLAESLGGVESLITHPSTMTHADIPLKEQAAVGLTPSLVRLSVGIENPDDLIGDIAQALRKAKPHS